MCRGCNKVWVKHMSYSGINTQSPCLWTTKGSRQKPFNFNLSFLFSREHCNKSCTPLYPPNRHYSSGIGDQNFHLTHTLPHTCNNKMSLSNGTSGQTLTSTPSCCGNEAVPLLSGACRWIPTATSLVLARWHLPQQSLWVGLWISQLPSVNKVMPLFYRVLWAKLWLPPVLWSKEEASFYRGPCG